MVLCWVMLGVVVAKVVAARTPVYQELALVDAVLDPVETHVHGLGLALAYGAVGDASGANIVYLNVGGRLWMTNFDEGGAECDTIVGIVEETSKFRFGVRGNDVTDDGADGANGAIVGIG